MTLAVRAGSGDEGAAEVGLASFVARMLLEGTSTRTAEQIAEAAARWGGLDRGGRDRRRDGRRRHRALRAVTPEDVQGAARAWLDPARMAIVVVGDERQVGAQVMPFGPAPRG